MSFRQRFRSRYEDVIAPAIESFTLDGSPLQPHRVDETILSDSILAEIVSGITNDLLVFVDVTTLEYSNDYPVRNANVLYELGMAHAWRAPEQVLVFRSDEDPLPFDCAGIRIRSYHPDENPVAAEAKVQEAIENATSVTHLVDRALVKQTAGSIDMIAWHILWLLMGLPPISPQIKGPLDIMRNSLLQPAVHRMLDLGVIEVRYERIFGPEKENDDLGGRPTEDIKDYTVTPLGNNVFLHIVREIGMADSVAATDPETARLLERLSETWD